MSQPAIKDILLQCLGLEVKAAELYEAFARQAPSPELRKFWLGMLADEVYHIEFWKMLAAQPVSPELHEVFESPAQVKKDLEQCRQEINSIVIAGAGKITVQESFFLAFRLEFSLLYPAFSALFAFVADQTGRETPATNYPAHLERLLTAPEKFHIDFPCLQLFAQVAGQLWRRNRELTEKSHHIKSLQGLIPMCAACKKIRDDRGYWYQLEKYLTEHSAAEITHGLCPDCIRKLYPDLVIGDDMSI